jgi:hypothetical protein
MRRSRFVLASVLAVCSAIPALAAAQASGSSDEERKKLEEEIRRELGGAPGATPPAAPPPGGRAGASGQGESPGGSGTAPGAAPAPGQGATGGSPYARVLLLPDISAIGSAGFAYDSYDAAGLSPRNGPVGPAQKPHFYFEELELGLQAVVDPYARADVFISFSQEGAAVEEAYLTTLSLPAGLQVRAGRFFSPFGRMNPQHPHVWEFVDAPLARGRLLAEETLAGPGVDVAWLTPLPWYAELHLAGQDTAPASGDPERFTGVARLLQYFTLGDATTLGVGLSAAWRQEQGPGASRQLGGADAYLRFRPLDSRSYLALTGEVYARRLRSVADQPSGTHEGFWAQAFWRDGAYLGYGVRYERAPAFRASGTEQRTSAVATWFPSEFQRLRAQASWDQRPGSVNGWELLLALEFGVGAHGAHPF